MYVYVYVYTYTHIYDYYICIQGGALPGRHPRPPLQGLGGRRQGRGYIILYYIIIVYHSIVEYSIV